MSDEGITPSADEEFTNSEIAVDGIQVLPRTGIDILPGGCYQDGCMARIQVVDVIQGKCYWIPVGRNALNALMGQAQHCLDISDQATARLAELQDGDGTDVQPNG